MDREEAIRLIKEWSEYLKSELGIHYSIQARRIGRPIATYTAIRLDRTNASEELLINTVTGLVREFGELYDKALEAGIQVDPPEYTRDELVRLLRDKIRRLQEENDELIDQLEKKGIAPPD